MTITDTHVYFYSGKDIYSNWHKTKNQFTDPNNGLKFDTTEQHFMWSKAMFFHDLEIADKAAKETDPRKVKELGRQVRGYNDVHWEKWRLEFMVLANFYKFNQNPDWKYTLLSTGNRTIVEASPYDKIWGVGLAENDPLILDDKNWKGRNLLGIALGRVREMIRALSCPEFATLTLPLIKTVFPEFPALIDLVSVQPMQLTNGDAKVFFENFVWDGKTSGEVLED